MCALTASRPASHNIGARSLSERTPICFRPLVKTFMLASHGRKPKRRQADQIVLAHLMVEAKSNEIPAAPELIEALGLTGCVFTLDAEHCQKKPSSA